MLVRVLSGHLITRINTPLVHTGAMIESSGILIAEKGQYTWAILCRTQACFQILKYEKFTPGRSSTNIVEEMKDIARNLSCNHRFVRNREAKIEQILSLNGNVESALLSCRIRANH